MKIGMIGFRGIPHTYGGGDEFIRYLGPGLAARGNKVVVYCWSQLFKDKSKYYNGVERIFIPTFNHKSLGQLYLSTVAVIHMLFIKVDIVYIHTLPSGLHSIIPWLFRKKIVVNTDGFDWLRDKWGIIGKTYFKLSARVVTFTANRLVSDAEGIRDYYLRKFNVDSTVIAYGANIETTKNKDLIKEFGVEPYGYFLIACRFVPENNISLIISAFEKVKTDKKLLIAGAANYKSDYFDKCKSTKDARIKFLGHISDYNTMKELHCNCYAYLHGHSMGGTNPALLKALGYGNCILALDTVFNREVLDDKYGIIFKNDVNDLVNKLQEIIENPSKAENYRRNAPNRITEAYTWEKIINDYEKLFKSVLS
jgi:glycosyltransferase involved in cell wall biosynthesis